MWGRGAERMKKHLGIVLKGMAYGVTHLVPGLGGGLILILLGIYEQFVEATGNLLVNRRRWREYVSFLAPLGVGMVASMVVCAKLITLLLERYPAATMFFFMGLVVGTIPTVLKLHHDMRLTVGRGVAMLVGLLVVVGLRAIGPQAGHTVHVASISGLGGTIYNTVTSFLAGGASVTPGLDGSYIWMLAGTYEPITKAIGALSALAIDWATIISTGVGAVLGILIFSKLIDEAIKRVPATSYYCVLGIVAGSVYGLWPKEPAKSQVSILAVACAAGFALALILGRLPQGESTRGNPSHD